MVARVLGIACVIFGMSMLACSRRGPRDIDNQNRKSVFEDGPRGLAARDAGSPDGGRVITAPTPTGLVPRELVRVSTGAIAASRTHVYFGDDDDDALLVLPKHPSG